MTRTVWLVWDTPVDSEAVLLAILDAKPEFREWQDKGEWICFQSWDMGTQTPGEILI